LSAHQKRGAVGGQSFFPHPPRRRCKPAPCIFPRQFPFGSSRSVRAHGDGSGILILNPQIGFNRGEHKERRDRSLSLGSPKGPPHPPLFRYSWRFVRIRGHFSPVGRPTKTKTGPRICTNPQEWGGTRRRPGPSERRVLSKLSLRATPSGVRTIRNFRTGCFLRVLRLSAAPHEISTAWILRLRCRWMIGEAAKQPSVDAFESSVGENADDVAVPGIEGDVFDDGLGIRQVGRGFPRHS